MKECQRDATSQLTVDMQEEAPSQASQVASRSWKNKEVTLPTGASRRMQLLSTAFRQPSGTLSGFWHPDYEVIHSCCFKPLGVWQFVTAVIGAELGSCVIIPMCSCNQHCGHALPSICCFWFFSPKSCL